MAGNPGTLLDNPLNPDDLPYVIKAVSMLSGRWKNIHTCLRITSRTCENILLTHPRIPMRCLIAVLSEWLTLGYDMERDPDEPSWGKVAWFVKEETGGNNAAQALFIKKNVAELSTFKPGVMARKANPAPLSIEQGAGAVQAIATDVAGLLVGVGANWFEIGVLLGVPVDTLERNLTSGANVDSSLKMIVEEWLNKFAEIPERRTWQILADAVEHPAGGGNRLLAKKIVEYSNKQPGQDLPPPPPKPVPQPQPVPQPPPIPFTTVSDVDICDVLDDSGFPSSSWQDLAPRLGIRNPVSIQSSKPSDSLRLQETIRHWRANDVNASWEKLADQVRRITGYGNATKKAILENAAQL